MIWFLITFNEDSVLELSVMKNTLIIIFLGLILTSCSSSTIKKVSFDDIKKIKNKDYIIVAFSGYQRSTDTRFEAQINSYSNVERVINDHCKNEGKNMFFITCFTRYQARNQK